MTFQNGNGEPGEETTTRRAKGRKDADKQEAVTKPKVVKGKIDELVKLYNRAYESGNDFSEAIKVVAESSGYNAGALRKFVVARANDKFADKKRDVEQQMELFEEVGE
jgi:hypothetical protein